MRRCSPAFARPPLHCRAHAKTVRRQAQREINAMPEPLKPSQPNPPVERSATMIEPPLRRPPNPPPEERWGTIVETDEDVRQALLSSLKSQAPGAPVGLPPSAPAPAEMARANGR